MSVHFGFGLFFVVVVCLILYLLMLGLLTSFSGNIGGKARIEKRKPQAEISLQIPERGVEQSSGYHVSTQCGIRKYHDAMTTERHWD